MRIEIVHKCGHAGAYDLEMDETSLPDVQAGLSLQACQNCQKVERTAAMGQRAQKAMNHSRAEGLAPLRGASIKQREFGEILRHSILGNFEKVDQWIEKTQAQVPEHEMENWSELNDNIQRTMELIRTKDDAGWWINHGKGVRDDVDSIRQFINHVGTKESIFI